MIIRRSVGLLAVVLAGFAVTAFARSGASADHTFLRFPWTYGTIAHVTQAYDTDFTHNGADAKALDFDIGGFFVQGEAAAAATGVVVQAVTGQPCDEDGNYGNFVIVRTTTSGGANRYARYAHLSAPYPSLNSTIYQGQKVGLEGNSGNTVDPETGACGTHLHFAWTSVQNCTNSSCSLEPEPMSGEPDAHAYTSFAAGQLWPSDNSDRPPLIEGMIIKGSGPSLYVVDNGAKRLITTPTVYNSCGYNPNPVDFKEEVSVSNTALSLMSNGPNVTGRPCPYTLMKSSPSSPHIYVTLQGTKLRIADPNIFNACGYNGAHIVIGPLPPGDGTLSSPPCPYVRWPWHSDTAMKGALVKGSAGDTYVLDLAGKHHITSPAVFDDCGYRWNDVATMGDPALALTPKSGPVLGKPCPYTLVRPPGPSTPWHVFSDGLKYHIANPDVFLACGYNSDQIVEANAPGNGVLPKPPCPYTRD